MGVGSSGRGEREPETARARDEVGVGKWALKKSRPFDGVYVEKLAPSGSRPRVKLGGGKGGISPPPQSETFLREK